MSVAVVVVAAGNGERLGANKPKALVKAGGKSLLLHALDPVIQFAPDQLIVVGHEDQLAEFASELAELEMPFTLVQGGTSRQGSVANGLAEVTTDLVLVHDAARAFTPLHVFESVASALQGASVAIPVLAISDTVKKVAGNKIVGTVDRSELVASQTPQGFRVKDLSQALSEAVDVFTDEAALMESAGFDVVTVPGDERSFKITLPGDLLRANQLLGAALTGIGTDAHEYSSEGELVLGTLVWPEHKKLAGHSDADSISHAIVDALLSAAKLGDIGSNFGVDRPEYSGASGEVFISGALKLLYEAGFEPVNVAVQVIADKPKIGPRRQELERKLSALLSAPVSVGATTSDGLGFLSDSRGVAAVATALIRARG